MRKRSIFPSVQRVTLAWLFLVAVVPSAVVGLWTETSQASSSPVQLIVCRANVTPCQTDISIPVGGTVSLDLMVELDSAATSVNIVAWEAHQVFSNPPAVAILANGPVQEQGSSILALNGLERLSSHSNSVSNGYFAAQNRYDPLSGILDYTVTMTGFNLPNQSTGIRLDQNNRRATIGRITVQGQAAGLTELAASKPLGNNTQVITQDGSGNLSPLLLTESNNPVVSIRVGPVSTVELQGQLARQGPMPDNLSVTLWRAGAKPQWLGGNDTPLAGFHRITPSNDGRFKITDIPASLVPPGEYDLRVKGNTHLTSVLRNVAIPESGQLQSVVSITMPQLKVGDLNGDNIVDRADVQVIKGSFGMVLGDPGFNLLTDFNHDQMVDVADFSTLSRNFGARGE